MTKWILVAPLMLLFNSCDSQKAGRLGPDNLESSLGPPPASLGLAEFYKKHLDAEGIPVLSSEQVPDSALFVARDIIVHMLSKRGDVKQAMIGRAARVAVMAVAEVTTDIPEHRYLMNDPNVNWDEQARGIGATVGIPITTSSEENLLCYTPDRFSGENMLIHEFAHAIHNLGAHFVDPEFEGRLASVYKNARSSGLWQDTFAATNKSEYWAEGVQSWFNANLQRGRFPMDGHNNINTRGELQEYDISLYRLIEEYLPNDPWTPACLSK